MSEENSKWSELLEIHGNIEDVGLRQKTAIAYNEHPDRSTTANNPALLEEVLRLHGIKIPVKLALPEPMFDLDDMELAEIIIAEHEGR